MNDKPATATPEEMMFSCIKAWRHNPATAIHGKEGEYLDWLIARIEADRSKLESKNADIMNLEEGLKVETCRLSEKIEKLSKALIFSIEMHNNFGHIPFEEFHQDRVGDALEIAKLRTASKGEPDD